MATVTGTSGNDTLNAASGVTQGDDSITGLGGNDLIYGLGGNDTIYGGGGPGALTFQDLNWSAFADDANLAGGFTQNTGLMNVMVSYADNGGGDSFTREDNDNPVYNGPGETFATNSSGYLRHDGDSGPVSTVAMQFAAASAGYTNTARNVAFRINDIDRTGNGRNIDEVTIRAYDANNQLITVTVTGNGDDTVTVNPDGSVTVNAAAGSSNTASNSLLGSVLVQVGGPVARIEVAYVNAGSGSNQPGEIFISDVQFYAELADNDTIYGGAGNDFIDGGEGADSIYGEAGNDTLIGGPGADRLDGGADIDTVDYSGSNAGVTVNLVTGAGAGGHAQGDTLVGIENVTGSAFDDSITGDANANTILGGTGDDTINGGAGNDYIVGGPDSIAGIGGTQQKFLDWTGTTTTGVNLTDNTSLEGGFTQNTGGINVAVSYTESSSSSFIRVETADIYVDPTPLPWEPAFDANSAAWLSRPGGSGNSSVTMDFSAVEGSGFADEVQNVRFRISDIDTGGFIDLVTVQAFDAAGNPVAVSAFQTGNEIITTNPDGSVTVQGVGNSQQTSENGSVLFRIEDPVSRVVVSYADGANSTQWVFISDVYFDAVYDGEDDDVIYAGDGDDTVLGGEGADSIFGQGGNDSLMGGRGSDTIDGGSGTDTIDGGEGADLLGGGLGSDRFVGGTAGDTVIGGEDTGDTDTDVLDLTGLGPLTVTYTPGDPEAGTVTFYADTARTIVTGTMQFSEIENVIRCFTAGTRITTPSGAVPVEELEVGDLVLTRDNGARPIRWIGRQKLSAAELAENPRFRPVTFAAGSMGEGLPLRDLTVSPQHRMLIASQEAELMFGEHEVLVPARHIAGKAGVSTSQAEEADYVHILFDQHEIVLSEGVWSESFQPGQHSLGDMDDAQRSEIFALFPELAVSKPATAYPAARITLKAKESALLF